MIPAMSLPATTATANPGEPSFKPLRAEPLPSPKARTVLFAALLVAAVVGVYSPVVNNGFLNFDDDLYITDNHHVKAGLAPRTVKWAFTTFDAANYHPLTWLSH